MHASLKRLLVSDVELILDPYKLFLVRVCFGGHYRLWDYHLIWSSCCDVRGVAEPVLISFAHWIRKARDEGRWSHNEGLMMRAAYNV